MRNRRDIIRAAAALPLALSGTALTAGPGRAQQYPSKTINVVTPFPPGGVADYASRPLAAFLTEKFPHPAVVENRAGAGGGVGHSYVARAEPDGHTIMVTLSSLAVIPEANRLQGLPPGYDMADFAPIARMFANAPVIAVRGDAPWKTMQDLLDDAKANPGKISYASSGQFGTVHLAMEMALQASGAEMLHVPFRGGGPAVAALVAGQIAVRPTVLSNVKGLVDSGKVRLLAQLGEERMSMLPDLPTMVELGYKSAVYLLWTGVFAPAKTPRPVQETLRAAIKEFMSREDVLEMFRKGGTELGYLDGPEFAKFLEADTARLLGAARRVKLT
jgi:tripartite-type tricarboxylate transporter receptor subunit TctC